MINTATYIHLLKKKKLESHILNADYVLETIPEVFISDLIQSSY